MLEIFQAPKHLRATITKIRERKDRVVVSLRYGITVSAEFLLAESVARDNRFVNLWRLLFHPGKQGGAEVERDGGVVVDDARDLAFGVQNASGSVGCVALGGDALV